MQDLTLADQQKKRGMTMQDLTMTDQITGVDIARPDIGRPKSLGGQ